MRQADVPLRQSHFRCSCRRLTIQKNSRAILRVVTADFDVTPAHFTESCAECLRNGLLRREARGKAVRLVITVGALAGRKEAVEESLTKPRNALFHPLIFDHVNSAAQHSHHPLKQRLPQFTPLVASAE